MKIHWEANLGKNSRNIVLEAAEWAGQNGGCQKRGGTGSSEPLSANNLPFGETADLVSSLETEGERLYFGSSSFKIMRSLLVVL